MSPRPTTFIAEVLEYPLTFAFYEDPDLEGVTQAHCLELDIVGQGRDIDAARRDLMDAVEAYVALKCEQGEHDIFCPAPAEVWNKRHIERWNHRILVRCFWQKEAGEQKARAEVDFLPNATRMGIALAL